MRYFESKLKMHPRTLKVILLAIILLIELNVSCDNNQKYFIYNNDLQEEVTNVDNDNYSGTKKELINYLFADTNICIDNSRRISPLYAHIKIGTNMPPTIIQVYFDTVNFINETMYIDVIDSVTGKLIQRIDPLAVKSNNSKNENTVYFTELHFGYYNLDDYLDLYFLQDCGAHGPCVGYYFLYDLKKRIYIYAKQYENLVDISVDKKNKLIYSINNSGDGYWTYRTFKLRWKQLYLIDEESLKPIYSEENSELYYYSRIKRDKWRQLVLVEDFYTRQFIGAKYFKNIKTIKSKISYNH